MKNLRYAAIFTLTLCLVLLLLSGPVESAPAGCEKLPPCDPAQQREDIFPCTGCNMQALNPVTVTAKAFQTVSYRLLTMPGCSAGTVPGDMARVEEEALKVNLRLLRNDSAYNFTVRVNCGSEQIRYCGAVTMFCLGRGFPGNADVEISDIISTYFPDSRLGILLHEIIGHAVGSWNEQYALCGASCGFQPTPNLRDYMNTGPDSRHGIETGEINRWIRTMYSLAPACVGDPCFDGKYWRFSSGFYMDPATDQWFDPKGRLYWTAREPWGGRCSPLRGLCWQPGATYYDIELGDPWVVVP